MIEVILDPAMAPVLANFAIQHGAGESFYRGVESYRKGRVEKPTARRVTSPQQHLARVLTEDFEGSIRNPESHGIMIATGEHSGSTFTIQGLVHYTMGCYTVDILDLVIHSRCRNTGIGGHLLDALVKGVAEPSDLWVTVEVSVDQPEVQLWMEKRGFHAVSVSFARRGVQMTEQEP